MKSLVQRICSVLSVATMMLAAMTISPPRAEAQHLARPHVATWNIWGGTGNAYLRGNPEVARFWGSNTVQTRIRARWPYMYGLGLQEVCKSQYDAIRFELLLGGYWLGGSIGGSGGYTDKPVTGIAELIGTARPSIPCGDWYGSVVYLRGASSGTGDRFTQQIQPPGPHPTKYNYVCLWNLIAVCSAHLAPNTSIRPSQSDHLKAVGNLLVSGGHRTFVAADFNEQPGATTFAWAAEGWRDADQHSGGVTQETTHEGYIIDYVWSKNPNTWYTDAWVPHSSSSLSDHYWKQGYF